MEGVHGSFMLTAADGDELAGAVGELELNCRGGLVDFGQRPGNLAWTREIGMGKRGSKLYVHGRGEGKKKRSW